MVAFGQDWNQPYSCSGWGTTFGLSHPIVDDINNIYGLFGIGYIPHNIVIGGDGQVLYSDSGYNQAAIIAVIDQALEDLPSDLDEDGFDADEDNCPDNYNPSQADIDGDGDGDACDVCDNANVFVVGNVNGDLDSNNQPRIDFFDVVSLLDHLQSNEEDYTAISECHQQSGNINADNNVNIIDVVNLVNMLLFGRGTTSDFGEVEDGIISFSTNAIHDNIILESKGGIAGFQFNVMTNTDILNSLEGLSFPEGWSVSYSSLGDNYKIFAYDQTGNSSLKKINLNFKGQSILDISDVIVSDPAGNEVVTSMHKFDYQAENISLPNRPEIQKLYPNPFNPSLSISFSLPSESDVTVAVYNMLGEKVVTLLNNSYTSSGYHSLSWDATGFPSGMYFIKVQTPSIIDTKKAFLIK